MLKRLGGDHRLQRQNLFMVVLFRFSLFCCLKKNLNAPRPSEHPPVRGPRPFVQSFTRFFLFFLLSIWRYRFFRFFCTISAFSLYGEYDLRSFLPNGVFYLVTTGWIFGIGLRANLTNQSTNQCAHRQPHAVTTVCCILFLFLWRCGFFRVFLCQYRFSLCIESTS